MDDTNSEIRKAIQALREHTECNADTGRAVADLIDAMRGHHADMQEQHRDLEEQHKDNQAINDKMMWATIVMTIATVVMAWDAVSR